MWLKSLINTLPVGNNLGFICPQCGIIESHVTALQSLLFKVPEHGSGKQSTC